MKRRFLSCVPVLGLGLILCLPAAPAAFAVGLFQGQILGFIIGIACYLGSMYLTRKIGGETL